LENLDKMNKKAEAQAKLKELAEQLEKDLAMARLIKQESIELLNKTKNLQTEIKTTRKLDKV
jgi:hypothetical protein